MVDISHAKLCNKIAKDHIDIRQGSHPEHVKNLPDNKWHEDVDKYPCQEDVLLCFDATFLSVMWTQNIYV